MKRKLILDLLDKYHPTDLHEQKCKKQIVDFITTYEDCFERSLLIGHITCSGWLLNKEKTKALLMHHTKLNIWVQLGGHCDGESDVFSVAKKELQEESGIIGIEKIYSEIFDIDVHTVPARPNEPEHIHYDIRFLFKVTSKEKIIQNKESKELRWISKDSSELPTRQRSVTRMFDKWVNFKSN